MTPRKRLDRLWWALLAITLIGFAVAVDLTRRAEDRRTEWVGPLPSARDTPPPPRAPAPAPAPPSVAESARAESAVTARRPAPRVVELMTTPASVTVGAMTPACRAVMKKRGPWKDALRAEPWPECVDAQGHPMVVQFCTYARLDTGEWIHTENTKNAPRCRAELPLVREGKVRGIASR